MVNRSFALGRTLFPATGYLVLVWETFAIMLGKLLSNMKVVFEDVKYMRASNVPLEGSLELVVVIHMGTQLFEVKIIISFSTQTFWFYYDAFDLRNSISAVVF